MSIDDGDGDPRAANHVGIVWSFFFIPGFFFSFRQGNPRPRSVGPATSQVAGGAIAGVLGPLCRPLWAPEKN